MAHGRCTTSTRLMSTEHWRTADELIRSVRLLIQANERIERIIQNSSLMMYIEIILMIVFLLGSGTISDDFQHDFKRRMLGQQSYSSCGRNGYPSYNLYSNYRVFSTCQETVTLDNTIDSHISIWLYYRAPRFRFWVVDCTCVIYFICMFVFFFVCLFVCFILCAVCCNRKD